VDSFVLTKLSLPVLEFCSIWFIFKDDEVDDDDKSGLGYSRSFIISK
ncbi:16259_t:CDS:2, partial [Entrophospora sp. SA101]